MPTPADLPIAPRPIPPDHERCTRIKADGNRCRSSKLSGQAECVFHAPRIVKPKQLDPSLSLAQLAALDWSSPDALHRANVGVWQHLLAETIAPHVAKVALDVAERLSRGATRKDAGASVTETVADLLKHSPPTPDD